MSPASKVAWLLCSLLICIGAVFLTRNLERQPAPVQNTELYSVVWTQINAFRKADYPSAYQQVSSHLQETFNIEAFAERARTDYPEVRRTQHVEFGDVQVSHRHALVQVFFVLPDGEVVPCVYSLLREENGWKIDGAKTQKRLPSISGLGGMRS